MKRILTVLLAAALLLALTLPALADERAAEWLAENYGFGITFSEEVTLEEVNTALGALGALGAEPIEAESLTLADVCEAAVKLAGMDEFAQTYVSEAAPEKVSAVLADYGVAADEAAAPYVAAALDLEYLYNDEFSEKLTGDAVARILYRALEDAGQGRRYVGRVFDDGIRAKVAAEMDASIIFDDEQLTELGTAIVLSGAATGYNLKYEGNDARFLPEYTLRYSHDSARHALQLIALLKSEDIDGYIQVEPKVSVYEYMIEWGEPGEPTPTYAVRQVEDGRWLVYAVEYDLAIEFDTLEAKEAFHGIVEKYAKKYDASFDADGNLTAKLLADSWWQPLYSSTTRMQNGEFEEMVDNVIYNASGAFSIHPFSLKENTARIAEVVRETAPELAVIPRTIYVNPAFYRYTTGSDHQ